MRTGRRADPRPEPPLLDPSARRWAAVLAAGCAVAVAVLGIAFAHQTSADRFDQAVDTPIIDWFQHRIQLAAWLAAPGSGGPAAVLTAAMAAGCLLIGRVRGALLAVAGVPLAVALAEGLLKPLVHRTYLGNVVYPSGHSTAVFALATAVTVACFGAGRRPAGSAARALIPAAALILGIVVAIAVIGLRWHYVTDTVAGAALGIGTVCATALCLDAVLPPRSRDADQP